MTDDHFQELPAYKLPIIQKLRNTSCSSYLYANIIYLVYSAAMYQMDIDPYSNERENSTYFIYGICHLFSAVLYAFSWHGQKEWYEVELFPEYLNIMGSTLWLYSAKLYPDMYVNNGTDEYGSFSPIYYTVRKLEVAAASLEFVASFLWVYAWYRTYMENYGTLNHPTAARGVTLDDPDFHANITIIFGATLYLIYEIQIYLDDSTYGNNLLYETADFIYLINAIAYTVGCLRDLGWCWFMPAWGRFDSSWEEVEYKHYNNDVIKNHNNHNNNNNNNINNSFGGSNHTYNHNKNAHNINNNNNNNNCNNDNNSNEEEEDDIYPMIGKVRHSRKSNSNSNINGKERIKDRMKYKEIDGIELIPTE